MSKIRQFFNSRFAINIENETVQGLNIFIVSVISIKIYINKYKNKYKKKMFSTNVLLGLESPIYWENRIKFVKLGLTSSSNNSNH